MGKGRICCIALILAMPVAAIAADVAPAAVGPEAVAAEARGGIVDGARDGGRTVVGIAEARRRLGRPLAEALTECGDDTGCLSGLAGRLGAEIWLAEVFDAGDEVPIGLRRIGPGDAEEVGFWAGVPKGEVRASVYGVVLGAVAEAPAQGRLTVHAGNVDAEVTVGDRLVGRTPVQAVPVSAGAHRVVVRSPGYHPWSVLAQVRPDRETRLETRLSPDIEGGLPLAGLLPADTTDPGAEPDDPSVGSDAPDLSPAGAARADRPPPPWLSRRRTPSPAALGSLGGGLAAMSVAVAFGIRADAAAAAARDATIQLDVAENNAAAQRGAYAANGFYAVGTVALGLGTYLLFRDLAGSDRVTDP
jgi:hypothetical protein